MGGPAWEIPGFSFSLPAYGDYSVAATYQYTPVRPIASTGGGPDASTGTSVAPVASTGDPIIGVMQNNPQLAEAATIVQSGVSKCLVKEAVAIGATLSATPANGFKNAASGEYQSAIALEASGGAGELVAALLVNLGRKA